MRTSDTRLVICPNASLSARHAWYFMALTASLGLSIGLSFCLNGFWPILPFCGLELAALGLALWVTQRRNRYRETLDFSPDRVLVRFGNLGEGRAAEVDWPRYWVRVVLEPGPNRNSHSRLLLTSAGQRLLVARCLTDQEREDLYSRIQELLPPVWQRCCTDGLAAEPANHIPNGG
jgi:uncharacterized membrane protein